ncbi:MAG: zinc-dependent metalloprotease [Pseudonocardiales bacterium]|nr:zinc-dependent metalloprotease [Pseudonocardiales bacterium]MBV9729597.1 zinc-dependent metalloprotease [Pseudonocardiales bacterium]
MGHPALDTQQAPRTGPLGPPIDWAVAAVTAQRLLPAGPAVPAEEAATAVRQLRALSVTAEQHVRELTKLDDGQPPRPAEVVDRPGWVDAATEGLCRLLPDYRILEGRSRRMLATTAGMQVGVALAFLASRVLGQYDPFGGPSEDPGRLLLVAPNVLTVGRTLDVPAGEFQMWVCLHEATHRLQFNAVPWLRGYFANQVQSFVAATEDPDTVAKMIGRLPAALRGARRGEASDALSVLTLLQDPEQRAVLDQLLALATLLEGHADHVMDAVGPSVVPSVRLIRQRFTARRQGGGLAERVLRAVLGIDAKLRQYAEGAAFTRHVVDAVGMDGFNAVWTSPETLPTRAEIADPAAWLYRMAPA